MRATVIIPALNEEAAIAGVVKSVLHKVDQVIVVDNGSTDNTAECATKAGAEVIFVAQPGYGRACLAGVAAADLADILVFMDGDAADDPDDLEALIAPIISNTADLVIGSRTLGQMEKGALTIPQRFGNALATKLMHMFWGSTFTDLGPYRAIKSSAFISLAMQAPTYGWTVEMQIRALKKGLRYTEVPVTYRRRIGVSKISGTVKGVILAGWYILGTIFWEKLKGKRSFKPANLTLRS